MRDEIAPLGSVLPSRAHTRFASPKFARLVLEKAGTNEHPAKRYSCLPTAFSFSLSLQKAIQHGCVWQTHLFEFYSFVTSAKMKRRKNKIRAKQARGPGGAEGPAQIREGSFAFPAGGIRRRMLSITWSFLCLFFFPPLAWGSRSRSVFWCRVVRSFHCCLCNGVQVWERMVGLWGCAEGRPFDESIYPSDVFDHAGAFCL